MFAVIDKDRRKDKHMDRQADKWSTEVINERSVETSME